MDVGVFIYICYFFYFDWDVIGVFELYKVVYIVLIVGRSSGRERGVFLEIWDLYVVGVC